MATPTAHRIGPAACAIVLALGLSACGGGSGGTHTQGSPSSSAAGSTHSARKSFDPPLRFVEANQEDELSKAQQPSTDSDNDTSPALTLADGVAYVTGENGLTAIDTQSGRALWNAAPTNGHDLAGFGTSRAAPLIVKGTTTTVFAAYATTVKGQGTTPDKDVLEVFGANAASGKKVFGTQFAYPVLKTDLSGEADELAADHVLDAPIVVAADETNIVVAQKGITYIVDRATGKLRWFRVNFRAISLSNGVVAGSENPDYEKGQLAGYRLDTGAHVWTAAKGDVPTASSAGPGLIAADVDTDQSLTIFDAVTGVQRARVPFGQQGGAESGGLEGCAYDQQAITVCELRGAIAGFDVSKPGSVTKLWVLQPSSDRVVPRVNTVWHSALYGETDNGPVILDARTGKDRATDPGAEVFAVDQYGGLAENDGDGSITAYTATG
ncbi:PQQ-binding-like beta-propeller repeat protein [Streptomyces sp. NPDC091215]|uniref:outer membrane protein assembly factor BamB family protein n=1 Tax=Streptomyces sp. NPDC091215 TaxID=3155192 RepID=UPI00342FA76F